MTGLVLTGFAHSVYTRAVRMALHEKNLSYDYEEVNPFTPEGQTALVGHHPFGRVPVLRHDDFVLYETAAILGYLDDSFDAPSLWPKQAKARARVMQVQGLVDSYLYQPLVRQVFSYGVYRPHLGEPSDPERVAAGLAASDTVLNALEEIAGAGLVLNGRDITRADCHLAPMIDYFAALPEARAMLVARPALMTWYETMSARRAFIDTRPDFMAELEGIT